MGDGAKEKVIGKNSKVLGEVEATLIDTKTSQVKTLGDFKDLNREALIFDFNSKEDFSPDADSHALGLKFWTYLLNPLPFE